MSGWRDIPAQESRYWEKGACAGGRGAPVRARIIRAHYQVWRDCCYRRVSLMGGTLRGGMSATPVKENSWEDVGDGASVEALYCRPMRTAGESHGKGAFWSGPDRTRAIDVGINCCCVGRREFVCTRCGVGAGCAQYREERRQAEDCGGAVLRNRGDRKQDAVVSCDKGRRRALFGAMIVLGGES